MTHTPAGRIRVLLLALTALAGCSSGTTHSGENHTTSAVSLRAALVSPTNIRLSWHDAGRPPAGHVVEYATDPGGPFTILGFLPPSQTTYAHSQLMPDTTFYYRVVPYYGPASSPVGVSLPPGAYNDQQQANDEVWATPRAVAGPRVATASIRDQRTAAAGTPTDLRATVMNANGVKLTWTDHARDAQGYLVEVRPAGGKAFQVIEVVGPSVNSCGVTTLPTEKNASFQVRAYYYGGPSNTAHQTTGTS